MNDFFKGEKLYGDDFSIDQIKVWFESIRKLIWSKRRIFCPRI